MSYGKIKTVLIIAVYYLSEETVRSNVHLLVNIFPSGLAIRGIYLFEPGRKIGILPKTSVF